MDGNVSLSLLPVGESAKVCAVSASGKLRQRLLDMGVIPGTGIHCLADSPGGDLRAYLIRGAVIALRRQDCQGIRIGGVEHEI